MVLVLATLTGNQRDHLLQSRVAPARWTWASDYLADHPIQDLHQSPEQESNPSQREHAADSHGCKNRPVSGLLGFGAFNNLVTGCRLEIAVHVSAPEVRLFRFSRTLLHSSSFAQ